jgi:hypothetical protein
LVSAAPLDAARRAAAGLLDLVHPAQSRRRVSLTVPLWAPIFAALIPTLMTGSWLLADALQSGNYSPVRQSVSVLAGRAGQERWIVTGALIVAGGCYLVLAARVRPLGRLARVGLIVAGASAIGIAFCPEPRHGSTPQHLFFTALGAVAIAVWPLFVLRPGRAPTPLLSARVSIAAAAAFIALLIWTFAETRSGSLLGLAERLSSSTQITWPFIVVYSLRRVTSADLGSADGSPGSRPWPGG